MAAYGYAASYNENLTLPSCHIKVTGRANKMAQRVKAPVCKPGDLRDPCMGGES